MSDRELFFEPGEYGFACFLGGFGGIWESGNLGIWKVAQVPSPSCGSGVFWLFWEMIPPEGYYFMRYAIAHF